VRADAGARGQSGFMAARRITVRMILLRNLIDKLIEL